MSIVEILAHPATINLPMYEGDDFSLTFKDWDTSTPEDWTGWLFQIREQRGDESLNVVEPTFDDSQQASAILVWSLTSAEVSADLDGWVYDLRGTSPENTVRTFLTGLVLVERQVSF